MSIKTKLVSKSDTVKVNIGANDPSGAINGFRWWLESDERLPYALKNVLDNLKQNFHSVEMMRQICVRLYGNQNPVGYQGSSFNRASIIQPTTNARLTYNVISTCIDTLQSKITKNRVTPMFLTEGGDYRLKRRAKQLNQFCSGIFEENNMHESIAPDIFRDAAIFGQGICHVYQDFADAKVKFERVIPSELYVDETEGFYGEPRSMYRAKNIDRLVLAEMFPEHAEAILVAQNSSIGEAGDIIQTASDILSVAEAWHLPSGKDADDGCHTICIGGLTLLREKYTKPFFPFAILRWRKPVYGWCGTSLAQDLLGTQLELNNLLYTFQKSMKLMGTFKIAVENGSKVPDSHLTNDIGAIIHYTNRPPTWLTPPAVSEQMLAHYERLKRQAFEISRISQATVSGQKPAGLNSGEAQRVYHDIESEGFQYIGRQWEKFHLDVAALAIDTVRDIYEAEPKKGKVKVKSTIDSSALPGTKFLKNVDWHDIKMEDTEYTMKAFPVSTLPSEPAGRLQTITELASSGFIDQKTAVRLLDFPDLDTVNTQLASQEDWIMSVLDGIVENGKMKGPDPMMDLSMARNLAQQEYAVGSANGLEDNKLEMLRAFIEQVDSLMINIAETDAAKKLELQSKLQNMQQAQQQALPPPVPMTANPTAPPQPVQAPQPVAQ